MGEKTGARRVKRKKSGERVREGIQGATANTKGHLGVMWKPATVEAF